MTDQNLDTFDVHACNAHSRDSNTHNPWDAVCVKNIAPVEPTDPDAVCVVCRAKQPPVKPGVAAAAHLDRESV